VASKNSIKIYAENTIYHVYNRGVEKRNIYQDEQDYKVFLGYLKEYLSPPPKPEELAKKSFTLQDHVFKGIERQPHNYFGKIEILAYCLMPNHFHLMLRQNDNKYALRDFLHSLLLRYSMYFNKKYNRVGKLFQDRYKAIIVMDEKYLLHLSRYIHINPYEYTKDLVNAYSSYAEYIGLRHTTWINTSILLYYFENNKHSPEFQRAGNYKEFIEDYLKDNQDILGDLILE
jgi:putative transposase